MILKAVRRWLQQRKSNKCTYHEWRVTEEADSQLWCIRSLQGYSFCEADESPGDEWRNAGLLQCKKCGGTFDERVYGQKWLTAKENGSLWIKLSTGILIEETIRETGGITNV